MRGAVENLALLFKCALACLGVCFGTSPSLGATVSQRNWIGLYLWGGAAPVFSISKSIEFSISTAADAGVGAIRVALEDNAVEGKSLNSLCIPDVSLTCFAKQLFSSSAWDNKEINRIIVTAIDRACKMRAHGPGGCLNSKWLLENRDAVLGEYISLFRYLFYRFGKKTEIIVTNWESDNFLYCGNAHKFRTNVRFKDECEILSAGDGGIQDKYNAFSRWMNIRYEALEVHRKEFPGTNVTVMPEYNASSVEGQPCGPSCGKAYRPLIEGHFRLIGREAGCIYSAWDLLKMSLKEFVRAIEQIRITCNRLIIGEIGISRQAEFASQLSFSRKIDWLLEASDVDGLVFWNEFDSADGSQNMGIFDKSGKCQNYCMFLGRRIAK